MSFVLSCCSTADLSKERFEKKNISYICFHYELDGVSYPDDLGQTMPFDQFYQAMVDGAETKTSQINVEEYADYFRSFLEAGKDILHVSLSSGISGTIQSANIAADMLRAEFPDRKIYIVDSLTAASGYGLLMDKLADLRDEGMTIDEVNEWALKNRLKQQAWFFSMDLTFFVKGGRISKASGWFGTVLKICPLLNVSHEGKLVPRLKLRGKQKAIEGIVQKMEELAENGLDYSGKCYLSHSACYEDAKAVADLVESKFKKLDGRVEIYSIGTTIGAHTGPGTVALFYWGKEKVD